jgi:hypothetical protein
MLTALNALAGQLADDDESADADPDTRKKKKKKPTGRRDLRLLDLKLPRFGGRLGVCDSGSG